jgi:hypothetical protein
MAPRLARLVVLPATILVTLFATATTGAAPSLQARCVAAGTKPLRRLSGRAFIFNQGGFSEPRLIIHWRSRRLPSACEGAFRRSVAVEVTMRSRNVPVPLPLGQGEGEVQWLTFIRGFGGKPAGSSLARGFVFSEPLGCLERVSGLVRYRVSDSNGRLLKQRFGPYEPRFHRCRGEHPSILPPQ